MKAVLAMPMADAVYHLLQYTDITEAASFVAALSRFLTYPPGSKYLSPLAPAEVLSAGVRATSGTAAPVTTDAPK